MRAFARRSGLVVAIASTSVMLLATAAAAETDDAIARILAETGAQAEKPRRGTEHKVVPAPRPPAADEQRLIEEIEMLERARAEAETRREMSGRIGMPAEEAPTRDAAAKPAAERTAEEQRRAEERQRAEAARLVAEAERKAAEERRIAEEKERLEQEQRRAEAARLAAEANRRAAEERRIAEERTRLADEKRRAEEAELAQMEAEREIEAQHIDEALRKAREARASRRANEAIGRHATDTDPEVRLPPPIGERLPVREIAVPDPAIGSSRHSETTRSWREDAEASRLSPRVTVLMAMEPGDRGIRRHNKTADPLLCGERGCYIGAGAEAPADLLPRRRAFGPGRTLGERAGACRNSLGCVFRGVDLVAYPAVVQPIDMRLVRHDRRQPAVLEEASECRLSQGRLSCSAIQGPDYTLWIVPEAIAERAGAAELQRVVETGLRSGALAARD